MKEVGSESESESEREREREREKEGRRGRGREKHLFVVPLILLSLVDSCMCPGWRLNLQP